jgi:hypothetical protein
MSPEQETRLFDNKENLTASSAVASPSPATLAKFATATTFDVTASPSSGTPLSWEDRLPDDGEVAEEGMTKRSPRNAIQHQHTRSPLTPHSPNVIDADVCANASPEFFKLRAGSTPGVTTRRGHGLRKGSYDDHDDDNVDTADEGTSDATVACAAPETLTPSNTSKADANAAADDDNVRTPITASGHTDAAITGARDGASPSPSPSPPPAGLTPANTPATRGGPNTDVRRTPSAVSPLEEDVVEEVRSWFASVHSKLDVALCAISPGGAHARQLRIGSGGATIGARAEAASCKVTNTSGYAGGLTPSTPSGGGAPLTPTTLRSLESPGTLMAPGGAISKFLESSAPSPGPETDDIYGEEALHSPETSPSPAIDATPASSAEKEGREVVSEMLVATATAGAMATMAALATELHTRTSVDEECSETSVSTPGLAASPRKDAPGGASDSDSSFNLSRSEAPPSGSSDANVADVANVDVAGAMNVVGVSSTVLRATCLLMCAALLSGDVIAFLIAAVSVVAGVVLPAFSTAAAPAPIKCVIHATYFVYPPALGAALRALEAYVFGGSVATAATATMAVTAAAEDKSSVILSSEGLVILAYIMFATVLAATTAFALVSPDTYAMDAIDAEAAVDAVDTSFARSDAASDPDADTEANLSLFDDDEDEDVSECMLPSPGSTHAATDSAADNTLLSSLVAMRGGSLDEDRSPDGAGTAGRLDVTVPAHDATSEVEAKLEECGIEARQLAEEECEADGASAQEIDNDGDDDDDHDNDNTSDDYDNTNDAGTSPPATGLESIKRLIFGAAGERPDAAMSPSPASQLKSTRRCHPPAARAMGAEVW